MSHGTETSYITRIHGGPTVQARIRGDKILISVQRGLGQNPTEIELPIVETFDLGVALQRLARKRLAVED